MVLTGAFISFLSYNVYLIMMIFLKRHVELIKEVRKRCENLELGGKACARVYRYLKALPLNQSNLLKIRDLIH